MRLKKRKAQSTYIHICMLGLPQVLLKYLLAMMTVATAGAMHISRVKERQQPMGRE